MGTVLASLLCLFHIRMKADPHANPSFSIDVGTSATRGNMTAMMPTDHHSEIKEDDMTAAADMAASASLKLKPQDTFPGTWLVSVGVKSQYKTVHDMLHFLNIIEVGEEEDCRWESHSAPNFVAASRCCARQTPF